LRTSEAKNTIKAEPYLTGKLSNLPIFSGKSIICFGGEDWWYHHPHSKNHLMRRFARAGNRVIFVNSISMGLASLTNKDLLPRVARKLKSYAKLARTTPEGITVVSPAALPFFGSRASRAANRHLLSAQIGTLARSRGLKNPILWIAIPTAVEMIGRMNESLVVYQVSDKYDANTMDHATNPATIRKLHERALDSADIILYSGRKLLAEATRGQEHSYLLEQAVDFDHWSRVGSGELEVAAEVACIPRPRIGYFGAIEPWLVDQELIKRASVERPSWHWVFIGNRSRGLEIEDLPNVHFLPPVKYDELPRYAAGFDVCVLPWETEQAFTSYGSAIKVREYLATGKPVVIAPLPEYEPMSDVLRIARSRDDFLRLIADALDEKGEEKARARQASVKSGTWDARAERVSDLIEEALKKKQNSESRIQNPE
jgi:glycosyltransferase involved in cell wall biosynthesis